MTATAPEREPLPSDGSAPAAVPPGDGEWEQLHAWWDGLPHGLREQLATLTPAEPLPRGVAAELQRRGLRNPLVLVEEGGRLVRRALPSTTLLQFLAAEGGGPAPAADVRRG